MLSPMPMESGALCVSSRLHRKSCLWRLTAHVRGIYFYYYFKQGDRPVSVGKVLSCFVPTLMLLIALTRHDIRKYSLHHQRVPSLSRRSRDLGLLLLPFSIIQDATSVSDIRTINIIHLSYYTCLSFSFALHFTSSSSLPFSTPSCPSFSTSPSSFKLQPIRLLYLTRLLRTGSHSIRISLVVAHYLLPLVKYRRLTALASGVWNSENVRIRDG